MQSSAEAVASGAPLFSVVVPTFNRGKVLGRMLAAWEAQKPDDLSFEIIAVDDGSTDETSDVLAAFAGRRCRLIALRQENRGPAVARNTALLSAQGRYVLFTGDDIEPEPDLLNRHLAQHRRLMDERWAVLGRINWALDLSVTSTMRHVDGVGAQQFSFHHMMSGEEYDFRHFYTSNVSVSRELLKKEPSGFSTDFPLAAFEDAEFAYRLKRHGLRILFDSGAQAWHHHKYDAASFFRRQVGCGKMAAVLIQKWPETNVLVGGAELRKITRKFAFPLGRRRRRVRDIGVDLDRYEALAIDVAAKFDTPPTTRIDPFLLKLFQYAYFRGLTTASFPETQAKQISATCFLDLVVAAGSALRETLNREENTAVEELQALLNAVSG